MIHEAGDKERYSWTHSRRFYHSEGRYNESVTRRRILTLALLPVPLLVRGAGNALVRGRLIQDPSRPPAIRRPDGKDIALEGDDPTVGVLRDIRLASEEFEATGEFVAPARFRVQPIHEKAMFVVRRGKRLVITYWCDTCSIRTYTPGLCVCCREETRLDPRDPEL